ncbi:laminin subunit alpha-3-like [Elysia marginata]|uniref:Laminin subunit alpha-3-like n=1 Tax=Elysia marginata TaxID=1093978 RepID=A0AAV4JBI5_9GAST|nr:laminin subunit alpha-3-like [Elysia marginata]
MPVSNMSFASLLSPALSILYVMLVSYSPQPALAARGRIRYVQLCKESHIQIMAHRGVRIEPYERSRVELKLAGYTRKIHRQKLRLHFEFKTTSANGTLFYGFPGNEPEYVIALTLTNGMPKYHLRCPNAHVDIYTPTPENKPLNDNEWHSVQFDTRYGHHGVILIDGLSAVKRYHVGCTDISTLVLGGHNPDKSYHHHHSQLHDLNIATTGSEPYSQIRVNGYRSRPSKH